MIIDIISLFIIFGLVLFGCRKGFMLLAFRLISFFLSLMIAWSIAPSISTWTYQLPIANLIQQKVYVQMIENEAKEQKNSTEQVNFGEDDPSFAVAEEEIRMEAAKRVAEGLLFLFSVIAIWLITKLLMFLIAHLLELVTHLPVIRYVNGILGGVFGFLLAIFLLEGLFVLLSLCRDTATGKAILDLVQSSYISKNLYYNNLLIHPF